MSKFKNYFDKHYNKLGESKNKNKFISEQNEMRQQ